MGSIHRERTADTHGGSICGGVFFYLQIKGNLSFLQSLPHGGKSRRGAVWIIRQGRECVRKSPAQTLPGGRRNQKLWKKYGGQHRQNQSHGTDGHQDLPQMALFLRKGRRGIGSTIRNPIICSGGRSICIAGESCGRRGIPLGICLLGSLRLLRNPVLIREALRVVALRGLSPLGLSRRCGGGRRKGILGLWSLRTLGRLRRLGPILWIVV